MGMLFFSIVILGCLSFQTSFWTLRNDYLRKSGLASTMSRSVAKSGRIATISAGDRYSGGDSDKKEEEGSKETKPADKPSDKEDEPSKETKPADKEEPSKETKPADKEDDKEEPSKDTKPADKPGDKEDEPSKDTKPADKGDDDKKPEPKPADDDKKEPKPADKEDKPEKKPDDSKSSDSKKSDSKSGNGDKGIVYDECCHGNTPKLEQLDKKNRSPGKTTATPIKGDKTVSLKGGNKVPEILISLKHDKTDLS